MPRRPRLVLPGTPLHLIQRGNNREACFYADSDYFQYLDWLDEYATKYNCDIHAYVLMTNHVHLLLTPHKANSVGLLMKSLGQRYVQYINRTYQRTGTLWEGRYRSCITQEEKYLLSCHRYIELNPVRANMVVHLADYRWSSYRSNAYGKELSMLVPHDIYIKLGPNESIRQVRYRELFRNQLSPDLIDEVRGATNGNFVLGGKRFVEQVSVALSRRVAPGISGRPKNIKV